MSKSTKEEVFESLLNSNQEDDEKPGARASSEEFELAPRMSSLEINLNESVKWLDPYHASNRAIFASYFTVGFGLYFIQTPLNFFMVNTLSATPAQQSVITGLLSLPWALKIFCGFLSDSVPIYGLRRVPWFCFGWFVFSLCNVILAIIQEPDIGILALLLFTMTMGFILADVCTDAMIVERSKAYESTVNRGTMQAIGYIIRFFGSIIGAACGAILYNKSDWGWGLPMWGIFSINSAIPFVFIFPFVFTLVEVKNEKPPKLSTQVRAIWALVQRKAVWQPCCFIYIYNVLLLTNPAWNSFLINGLEFSNFDIGLLTLFGTILSYFALITYKTYLFQTSWRLIYLFTTAIAFVFSCLQLVLVFGLNEKIGAGSIYYEILFAMVSNYNKFIQYTKIKIIFPFIPHCREAMGLCS